MLAISLLVIGTCAMLAYTSLVDLITGHVGVREGWLAAVAITGSLVIKLALGKRLGRLAAYYSSQSADALTIHLKAM